MTLYKVFWAIYSIQEDEVSHELTFYIYARNKKEVENILKTNLDIMYDYASDNEARILIEIENAEVYLD